MSTILQLGIPGGPELLVILFIAILLFGANKIPELARSTGQALGEFQKGRQELEQELQEMDDDKQTSQPETSTDSTTTESTTSTEEDSSKEPSKESS
jgi:sec-independent protein translocase protein TatA